MHVVMFGDQHVESLGGAQVSMRLQRRFLEHAGHTVTIVAPAMHGPRAKAAAASDAYVDMPSIPITFDREYSLTWPGRRTDHWVDAAMAARPPVDVVHVQADFWGAFIGYRFAARHALPVVHTMHNRVDIGIEATAPLPGLVLRALNAWERRALGPEPVAAAPGARQDPASATQVRVADAGFSRAPVTPDGNDGWSYLARMAVRARAVTVPSSHFARRLEQHGVAPHVDVVWNGIDDELLDEALAVDAGARAPGLPRFVWLGRMSPEKRLLPFLEAVAASGVVAEVEVIGGGGQLAAARRLVDKRGAAASIVFAGRLPYAETLRRIRAADAVVQTSIGFETQGMTVFEAASLGTPSIVCDPDIAAELGSGFWPVADASTSALAGALRAASADIQAGTAPAVDASVRERFRQSSRTEAMLEVYRRAIG